MTTMMPTTDATEKHGKYQSIVVANQEDLEDAPVETLSPRRTAVTKFTVGFIVVLIVSLVGSITILSSKRVAASPKQQEQAAVSSPNVPLEGMASPSRPRACTFDECLTSRCDAEQAPFLCLWHNGGPHGGCSPVPWNAMTCDQDCDTRLCASLPMPAEFDCHGKPCTVEWCETAGQQLCTAAAPFQCTTGAGRFGCTDDAFHWAVYGCECCDATTCAV